VLLAYLALELGAQPDVKLVGLVRPRAGHASLSSRRSTIVRKDAISPSCSRSTSIPNSSSITATRLIDATESQPPTEVIVARGISSGVRSGNTNEKQVVRRRSVSVIRLILNSGAATTSRVRCANSEQAVAKSLTIRALTM